jgi:hypothetical protein
MHLLVAQESLHQRHSSTSKDLMQLNQIRKHANMKKYIVRNNEKV